MPKIFMPELDPAERLRILRDSCDKSEETKYFKQLDQNEMDIRREKLADNSIKYFELSEELKEVKADFKDRMEPLTKSNNRLMQELKTGQAEIEGELFYMAEHNSGMMEVYDQAGELVSTRRLLPNEKQQRIPFIPKAANDQ
jgi:hypothetical protein